MKLWISLCLTLISSLAFAASGGGRANRGGAANRNGGHATGNGGGVICINGKCETLIDAGLRVLPEFDGVWIPTNDHYTLVKTRITDGLIVPKAIQADVYYRVFGRADHFRRVEVIDPVKVDLIKQRYLDVANKAGFKIDPSTFEVVAFSSDDTIQPALTYLLPKFFELSVEDQSKILIHEGLYRGQPSDSLRFVLQLENAIHAVIQSRTKCVGSMLDSVFEACMNQQFTVHRLSLMPKSALVGSILSMVSSRSKSADSQSHYFDILAFGSIKQEKKTDESIATFLQLDPQKILEFARFEPRLPYIFSQIDRITLEALKSQEYKKDSDTQAHFYWDDRGEFEITANCSYRGSRYGESEYLCAKYSIETTNLNLILPH